MFKLCTDEGYDCAYYPAATPLQAFFTAFTDKMMVSTSKKEVKSFSLESCHLFDLPQLEDAFDCEFVAIPDEIASANDFRKWIMEMKFE